MAIIPHPSYSLPCNSSFPDLSHSGSNLNKRKKNIGVQKILIHGKLPSVPSNSTLSVLPNGCVAAQNNYSAHGFNLVFSIAELIFNDFLKALNISETRLVIKSLIESSIQKYLYPN